MEIGELKLWKIPTGIGSLDSAIRGGGYYLKIQWYNKTHPYKPFLTQKSVSIECDKQMVSIITTLFNFTQTDTLTTIFGDYSNNLKYTSNGIFWRIVPPICPICNTKMIHNGYNIYCKKGLGSVKIGKYICPLCRKSKEEDRIFWEKLKATFFDLLNMIYQLMRDMHVSYQGTSLIMGLIFQGEKTRPSMRCANRLKKQISSP